MPQIMAHLLADVDCLLNTVKDALGAGQICQLLGYCVSLVLEVGLVGAGGVPHKGEAVCDDVRAVLIPAQQQTSMSTGSSVVCWLAMQVLAHLWPPSSICRLLPALPCSSHLCQHNALLAPRPVFTTQQV